LNLVLDAPQGRQALRLPLARDALARDVGRVLAQIGHRADALPLLQSLHASIAAPIVEAARRSAAQRLVLQLDGVLRYLPFAALHDGQRFLGERFAIEQRVATPATAAVPD